MSSPRPTEQSARAAGPPAGPGSRPDAAELERAIAMLGHALRGAVEDAAQSGILTLPRPRFDGAPVVVPAARTDVVHADPRSSTAMPVDAVPAVRAPVAAAATAAPAASPIPVSLPPAGPLAPASDDLAAQLARLVAAPAENHARLRVLEHDIVGACTRCKLHRGRSKLVFGAGNPNADLVFVGEGPGADEDRQGIPFVGRAGQLLTKMIEAMGFRRDDVYICNVVKCRPPNNRDPEPDEVEACGGFLRTQLGVIAPRVVVTLGRYAAHTLLSTKTPISKLRGTWQRVSVNGRDVPVMPTYHPSYLLREEDDPEKRRKREAWGDLKQVMQAFEAERRS